MIISPIFDRSEQNLYAFQTGLRCPLHMPSDSSKQKLSMQGFAIGKILHIDIQYLCLPIDTWATLNYYYKIQASGRYAARAPIESYQFFLDPLIAPGWANRSSGQLPGYQCLRSLFLSTVPKMGTRERQLRVLHKKYWGGQDPDNHCLCTRNRFQEFESVQHLFPAYVTTASRGIY